MEPADDDLPCPAGCVFSDCEAPGITRRKLTRGWGYYAPDGDRITDRDVIDRLNAIGLPPATAKALAVPVSFLAVYAIRRYGVFARA